MSETENLSPQASEPVSASVRRALVLGGSGTVGRAVVQRLCALGVSGAFTYNRGADAAHALADDTGFVATAVDFCDERRVRADALARIDADNVPDVLIHCAQIAGPDTIAASDDASLIDTLRIGALAPFQYVRAFEEEWTARDRGADIVLVSALATGQSVNVPPVFAMVQGMLEKQTMSLAKALGSVGVRINTVALGVLDAGLSDALDDALTGDYLANSALRRKGTAQEAAHAICHIALNSRFLSGKTIPVNGGI